jgi:hypothetical protein|tara:strand:+ start:17204 stop:17389 length:186 start_codon:yes stop_codon:yes gene_type:complete
MNQENLQQLVNIRMMLLENFKSKKDWMSNRSAIMREVDHIELLEKTIKQIDNILSGHVTFS